MLYGLSSGAEDVDAEDDNAEDNKDDDDNNNDTDDDKDDDTEDDKDVDTEDDDMEDGPTEDDENIGATTNRSFFYDVPKMPMIDSTMSHKSSPYEASFCHWGHKG